MGSNNGSDMKEAIEKDDVVSVKEIMKREDFEIDGLHENQTCLYQACMLGRVKIVKEMLNHPKMNEEVFMKGFYEESSHLGKMLRGAPKPNRKLISPLGIAAKKGHVEVVRLRVQKYPRLCCVGEQNLTPIYYYNNTWGDVNESRSPLFLGLEEDHDECAIILIRNHEMDPNRGNYKETPDWDRERDIDRNIPPLAFCIRKKKFELLKHPKIDDPAKEGITMVLPKKLLNGWRKKVILGLSERLGFSKLQRKRVKIMPQKERNKEMEITKNEVLRGLRLCNFVCILF